MKNIENSIKERKFVVGVVGLGYVGLPLATNFLKSGFNVIGVDIDRKKIELLKEGKSYIDDVSDDDFKEYIKNNKFRVYDDYSYLKETDGINICVPTPFTITKDPDVSYIVDAAEKIAKILRKNQIIILKSTTFPETTEKIVLPILEKSGLKVGKDFYLSFVPERVDPGNKKFKPHQIPAVVGGITKDCTYITCKLYEEIIDLVVPVSNCKVAEMTKLLENTFRNVNIALVNELALLCERMGGIDIWEVINAASTKPYGFMPFYPGPGIGGHCIPIDPYYLSWKAREYDFHTTFIELSAMVNEEMPYYVVDRIKDILNEDEIPIKKARILLLGVSFKENISDLRHSPALKIFELLLPIAREVSYNDPYNPEIEITGKKFKSVEINKKNLKRDKS
jgi:UDP-N-acetyl-D-glucosamine dehydrogenase